MTFQCNTADGGVSAQSQLSYTPCAVLVHKLFMKNALKKARAYEIQVHEWPIPHQNELVRTKFLQ